MTVPLNMLGQLSLWDACTFNKHFFKESLESGQSKIASMANLLCVMTVPLIVQYRLGSGQNYIASIANLLCVMTFPLIV